MQKTINVDSKTRPSTLLPVVALAALATGFLLFASAGCSIEGKDGIAVEKFEGKITAPDFPGDLEWLNTGRRLSLADLRGKIVMLDFWTYCCINCMHIIPDLKKLEEKYAEELVVIGVHSAKFDNEKDTDNIRQAILRYEIEHPVVNDSRLEVWRSFAVRSWPTILVIDPRGKVVGYKSGEGVFDAFDKFLGEMIAYWDARGELDRTPIELVSERDSVPSSILSFPGKVLADQRGNRLFVSDSNNNRIIVLSLENNAVMDVIGGGRPGFEDGGFDKAAFNHPQGLAVKGDKLYVADTENHAIRVADLPSRNVETLAGTGNQARSFNEHGPGRETPLNSPWDLQIVGGSLYIAMAGSHQLWVMDLASNYVKPYAGSGREARIDGPLLQAALAQPSGLTTDGVKLYFADSEISSIRSADLDRAGAVETIAGGDLFDFGDVDGIGDAARFQHPLGVAFYQDSLYVADTYNNKIRKIDIPGKRVTSFAGTGEEGMADGAQATFDEPGGLSIANGKLYIADTNNHLIRVADLATRQVETLLIRDIEKLKPASNAKDITARKLPARMVAPGEIELKFSLLMEPGYKLNDLGPTSISIDIAEPGTLSIGGGLPVRLKHPDFPASLALQLKEGEGSLLIDYTIYYCREGEEALCFVSDSRLELPVRVAKGSTVRKLEVAIDVQQ